MGRYCGDCGEYCARYEFSSNQWRKGVGASCCADCVESSRVTYFYQCSECPRCFTSDNQLRMHMQVHRPRNMSCPVCGETRFRSGANAVQHVESGYSTGCRGRDNARQQIYKFASSKSSMRSYMNTVPRLTNGGAYDYGGVPDYPYNCPAYTRSFKQLSQLLQHQYAKYNNTRMLGY